MAEVKVEDLEKLRMTQEQWDALGEEEQKQKIDELSQQAQESDTDKRIKGILAELREERKRRSISEERQTELEERIDELEELLEEGKETKEEPSTEEEGEFLTKGTAKKLLEDVLAKRESEFQGRLAVIEWEMLQDRLKVSEDAVMEQYSPEKVGEDLCYDKVIEQGFTKLLKENPGYRQVVLNSPNPAKEAYKIGLTHPDFQALLNTKAAAGVVQKITTPRPKTGVGSSQGAVGFDASKATITELVKLSDEELKKLAKET